MATIRATCDQCGDIDLRTPQVLVRVCADNNKGSYTFACPRCSARMARQAAAHVVDLLISTGCRMSVWRLPLELDEPHAGPPITYDDCIDFHDLLAEDGWQERIGA